MPYQVILFDLDDTLIDFTYSQRMGLLNIYKQFYSKVEYTLFERLYKEINTSLWNQVGSEKNALMPSDVRLLRFVQLNQKLFCTTPVEVIADEYDINLCVHAHWIPNVRTAIQFLHQKGHILGIITNGFVETQEEKRQRLQLNNWFDCYIVSDEVGVAKPNLEIFNIAIQEITRKRKQVIEKNSILMVGDSIISDGYGAKNFGIDYCFINNRSVNHESSAPPIRYTISSVAHLPACIGYETEYMNFLESRRTSDQVLI
ncbi:haloacid dehalogenase [Legionella qingyii]|uniref:HAD family hydrolase n=1 Tax=Legionella qingyii TaxID=2184757 RepID=A0A317TYX4_9GAMM|nr:HAD-IA family hydrolase [Legionella qingyii]PWY54874.1 haloacid dehalogenase [Legionella qingyii]RUR20923.1 HAD family hydrolase [Legionella qingyii]RUR23227.1 HAD family hydrolase [Legionella qingyii]